MTKPPQSAELSPEQLIGELIFTGFNSRVIALSRATGNKIWEWKCPKGKSAFVALLLDGDRLIASVQGYTYCLDPLSGAEIWSNPLTGLGFGLPSLVSVRGSSNQDGAIAAQVAAEEAQHQAAQHQTTMH
jgi:outer membrane protein assembly factor BamB